MSKKIFAGIPNGRDYYVVGASTKKKAYENMVAAGVFRSSYATWSKYVGESGNKHDYVCEPYEDVVFLLYDRHTIKERYEKVWPK